MTVRPKNVEEATAGAAEIGLEPTVELLPLGVPAVPGTTLGRADELMACEQPISEPNATAMHDAKNVRNRNLGGKQQTEKDNKKTDGTFRGFF